jgi:hypothetical protein
MRNVLRWLAAGWLFNLAYDYLRQRISRPFDPEDPNNWTGLDYVHERVLAQLDRQEARWKDVDDRLRFLLGVIGIIFAAGGGFMRNGLLVRDDSANTGLMPSWIGTAVIVAIVLYLIAGAMAAWAYRPQKFDRPPRPVEMRAEYVTADPRDAKIELIDMILLAYDLNEPRIDSKFTWFGRAYKMAGLATAMMVVAVIGQIALQTRAWGG